MGYVYMHVIRGIYGLPQSWRLANKLLKERSGEHNCYNVDHTPGLFTHKQKTNWFTLVIDDFGIKYIGLEHASHLLSIPNQHYDMETDWNR